MATALPLQGTFQSVRRWQDFAVMRSLLVGNGKILAESFPKQSSVARYWPKAFPGNHPWRDIGLKLPQAIIRGKIFTSCIRKGSSGGNIAPSWQHIDAMYPK
jgi:hypothetical protein